MDKTELIEKVATETGETKAQTQRIIESTLGTIEESLSAGEDVAVTGFGTWKVRHQGARTGAEPPHRSDDADPRSSRTAFLSGLSAEGRRPLALSTRLRVDPLGFHPHLEAAGWRRSSSANAALRRR